MCLPQSALSGSSNLWKIRIHANTNHPTAMWVKSPLWTAEKTKLLRFSPSQPPCLSLLIPMSSSVMVKNEAPYAASRSFFLIEVSDFPWPHTCVKQMIMLLESFTVTLLRWIWAVLSHHANVAARKSLSPSPSSLGRTIFAVLQRKITRNRVIQLFIGECKLSLYYWNDCYYYLFWV